MDLFNLQAKIGMDTGEFERKIKEAASSGRTLADTFGRTSDSVDDLEKEFSGLSSDVKDSEKSFDKISDSLDTVSSESEDAASEIDDLSGGMESAENSAEDLKRDLDRLADSADKTENSASKLSDKLKSGLATAGKATAAGIGAVTAAASAGAAMLLSMDEATEEYRIAQGKLNTAYETAGYSLETANKAYTEFYAILGDTDTATEASQLLAKLAQNEQDVSEWTNIAAGVWGTFGDSLPIEGLIESANETAKVGLD